jgi:hypothetical protein
MQETDEDEAKSEGGETQDCHDCQRVGILRPKFQTSF